MLAALQELEDTDTDAAETAAWQAVQRAVRYQLFGGDLPVRLSGAYVKKEALGLIDQVLDALSSQSKLLAALDPEGTGIFDHYDSDLNANEVQEGNFIVYDSTDRRYETTRDNGTAAGRTLSQFLGEREYTVVATLGTTAYTRFGAWGGGRKNQQRGTIALGGQQYCQPAERCRDIRVQPAGSDAGRPGDQPGVPGWRHGKLRGRDGGTDEEQLPYRHSTGGRQLGRPQWRQCSGLRSERQY